MALYWCPGPNGRSEMTLAGWHEMARMQDELAALTRQAASTLALDGCSTSRAFRAVVDQIVHRQREIIAFWEQGIANDTQA